MGRILKAGMALLLSSLALAPAASADPAIVRDRAALQRLRGNSGVTLHWIGFETPSRGHLRVRETGDAIHLSGGQASRNDGGRLTIEGDVIAIEARRFTFRGRIVITDAPDAGRRCVRDGTFEFRVTGQRRYWRLRQMEACDGLTDYVDIYF